MFKKTQSLGFLLRAILGAAMVTSAIACTKKNTDAPGSGETIKIGEVGSLTGDKATFGISTHQGIELAILEANEAGGVKGKKLEIVQYDNQGKPEEAATAMNRLITQDKVIAVLGEVASSISLAMAPLAQSNKIPMVTPSSTNPRVTQVGDYIFRVCFIDPFQGNVMATFAADHLKAKKVAILQDIKSDYSTGLAEFFAKKFKEKGGEIILTESYAEKDIDFKAQLTSIRSKKPDAIFVPGYYTEVALIARQAKELGINAPLLGGDGWDSPKLFEIGGKAVEGSYLSNHYSAEDTAEHVQSFIKKYKAKYGVIPDGLAAMGYDAAVILVDAMKRAGELTPAAIRDTLAATKDFKAVTGIITINSDRDAVKSAVVMKVDSGNFKYVTTINP